MPQVRSPGAPARVRQTRSAADTGQCPCLRQGRAALREQDRLVAAALAAAFRVALGGATGQAAGWGSCLAVHAPGDAGRAAGAPAARAACVRAL